MAKMEPVQSHISRNVPSVNKTIPFAILWLLQPEDGELSLSGYLQVLTISWNALKGLRARLVILFGHRIYQISQEIPREIQEEISSA